MKTHSLIDAHSDLAIVGRDIVHDVREAQVEHVARRVIHDDGIFKVGELERCAIHPL